MRRTMKTLHVVGLVLYSAGMVAAALALMLGAGIAYAGERDAPPETYGTLLLWVLAVMAVCLAVGYVLARTTEGRARARPAPSGGGEPR